MSTEFIEGIYDNKLGDEVSRLLVSGEWRLLSTNAPEEISPEEQNAIESAKNVFICQEVIGPFMSKLSIATSRSQAEKDLYEFFKNTKDRIKKKVVNNEGESVCRVAKAKVDTSIYDVHHCTEMQLDYFSGELGKRTPRTNEYAEALITADYWSKAEQLAKGAVECSFFDANS